MKTPEDEILEINELFLKSEQGLFPLDVVVFRVGECIIKYNDLELLDMVPRQIASLVEGMVAAYAADGEVLSYTSAGVIDQTLFVHKLAGVLRGGNKF